MSLILEALRKSEAERRRGDAPDLRVELPPAAVPKRHPLPALAWITGVALLALFVLAFLWPRDGGESGADTPVDNAPRIAEAPDASAAGVPDGAPAIDADAFPRVDRIQPYDDTPPAPPPTAVRTEAGAAAEAEDEAGTTPLAGSPQAVPPAAAPTPAPETVAPLPAPAPGTDPGPATPAPPPRTTTIPRSTELVPSQRQRLPAMKLSMHMWNEDPSRRFAVVDGQRKVEGDRVGDATITAIDREGLLLDLDGQAVRVPMP